VRTAFRKFRERKSIDFPIVNVAVRLSLSNGVIGQARVFAGAVAPMPLRLHAAEKTLLGKAPSMALCEEAALAAAASARPMRRTRYKQQLLKALVKRSLLEALGLEAT
jgi:CO/xanthine dehydrogenase FAD-binding subunit